MSRIFRFAPLVALLFLTVGCAHNYYNIPQETYEKQVRIIGVAPIFVDGDSDIRHPEREPLLALIRSQNRKNEKELVELLKETGVYMAVRMPNAQADELFSSLFFRRERRMDAGVTYNKYFFKQQELREIIQKNQLDALMVVVVSGLTRPEKIYASNLMSFLETDYNYLIITAQILDGDGNILWEYPNFQKRMLSLNPLFNLQYPDFDEAAANLTDKVDVKFKTIPGITRAFEQTKTSSVLNDGKVSKLYDTVFEDMVSMLKRKFRFFWETSEPTPVVRQTSEPVTAPPPPLPKAEPAVTAPAAPTGTEPATVVTEPLPLAPGEIKTEDLKPATK